MTGGGAGADDGGGTQDGVEAGCTSCTHGVHKQEEGKREEDELGCCQQGWRLIRAQTFLSASAAALAPVEKLVMKGGKQKQTKEASPEVYP